MPEENFLIYLRGRKMMLLLAFCLSTVLFLLLKYCFPYPDFFEDSTNYVLWAYDRFDVAYRPVGYSDFLRGVHLISSSAMFTVFVQYLLFFLSTLFCYFSTDYLFGMPQKLRWLLLVVLLANPLLLFQANLISSDSLFCSLTVTWITLCLWVIKRNEIWAMLAQLAVLYMALEARYTALFFPVVAVVAFVFCRGMWLYKAAGIAITLSFTFLFVQLQKDLVMRRTGVTVFSGFSGWQIANNALYCYKKINIDRNDLPTANTQILDQLVKRYIDTVEIPKNTPPSSAYIWHQNSPLKLYCRLVSKRGNVDYTSAWFGVSHTLSDYGWYIIQNFPWEFTQCYLLPNARAWFYPALETVVNYNASDMRLPPETKEWFAFDNDKLWCRYPDLQRNVAAVFPAVSFLLNVFIIAVICWFVVRHVAVRKVPDRDTRNLFVAWSVFYFAFMGFAIFAAAVNLRFMDAIFILGPIMSFALLSPVKPIEGKR